MSTIRKDPTSPPVHSNTLYVIPPEEQGFGRYTLLVRFAGGGMANLYLARYVGPDRFEKLVAVKRIHEHLTDSEDFVTMFIDEARVVARISHPNVVHVQELGRHAGSYFISMEYVDGESLHQLIKRTEIPFSHCARILSEAAQGLHAAHELRDHNGDPLNVVHRDVSPQNILISFDGAVKVVDFGVAKARSNAASTGVGKVKGKFAYMAPEQLKPGAFGPVDRRADVFGLGILLFEATTRRRLFASPEVAGITEKVLEREIPSPALYVEDYPDELAEICMQALQRPKDRRFQTAHQMHMALEGYLAACEQSVLPGDLAALMQRVFAKEREHKAEMLRQCLEKAPAAEKLYERSTVGSTAAVTSRRSWSAWLAVSVVVLALVGVVLYLLLSPRPEPVAVVAPPPTPDLSPAEVEIKIVVKPERATIKFDGKPVPNPYGLRTPPEDRAIPVEIEADGYLAQAFEVSLAEGGSFTIALEQAPRPDTGPPPKKRGQPGRGRPPRTKKNSFDSLFSNPYKKKKQKKQK